MAQVIMPQLGETVTEGTVGRWLKKVGDQVEKYEPLLEVETDKVASEIPSPFAGTLTSILAQEGTTVPVGVAICEIGEAAGGRAQSAPVAAAVPSGASHASVGASSPSTVSTGGNGVRYSPAVRKLAREHRVDLGSISGTGRGGRVTAHDVTTHVGSGA
ncbi:MAG: biotin/lipoyl-containing protein, partial [Candidatus Eremiobacterales bacterium]